MNTNLAASFGHSFWGSKVNLVPGTHTVSNLIFSLELCSSCFHCLIPFSVSFQGKTKRDPHIWLVITWDHYLSQGQRQQQWQPICPPGCPQSSTTAPSSPPWWWLGWSFKYIFNNNNLGNLLLTSAMEMLTGTLVVNWSSPDPPSMAITCKESKSQTSNYAKKIPPKSRR